MNKLLCVSAFAGILFLGTGFVSAQSVVAPGMKVKFDYTLTVDKEEVETTKGKQPLEYVDGKNMLIPGLEKELAGMKPGDSKVVTVKPEEGYGPVREDAIREFDKTKFPKDIVPQVGMVLEMQDPQGNPYPAMVKEVKDAVVVLDFNHPLAGKELQFDVKIVSIMPAPAGPEAVPAPVVAPEVKK